MAATREELMRYAMDCAMSHNVAERLEKVGWKHHPEIEGTPCGCGGSYVFPNEYARKARQFLRCDECKRTVKVADA